MPEIPQEAKNIHLKLLSELNSYIGPKVEEDEYEQFKNRFRMYLNPKELNNSKNVMDIFRCMEKRGHLKVNGYTNIKDILKDFDQAAVDIVEHAEEKLEPLMRTITPTGQDRKAASSSLPDHISNVPSSTGLPNISESSNLMASPVLHAVGTKRSTEDNTNGDSKKVRKECADGPLPRTKYHKERGQKGYVLVLNFTTNRPGSKMDVENIKNFFGSELEWKVEEQSNLSSEEKDAFLKLKQIQMNKPDFSQLYYCFVMVIMSHGKPVDGKDTILTGTADVYYDLDKIFSYFKNDKIPHFAAKPKVFLIQACRGSDEQGTVDVSDDDSTLDISDFVSKIPVDANLLLAYATTPGYKSHRDPNAIGSFFLHNVFEVFQEHYSCEHLEDMLLRVREILATGEDWLYLNNSRLMPCVWTTLTKRLYLEKE